MLINNVSQLTKTAVLTTAIIVSWCPLATAELVGHWTFDDDPAANGATLNDISGSTNVHNGTLNTVLTNAAVSGQIGGAFNFTDSGSDYAVANLGSDFVTGNGPASISFWLNPDDISGQAFVFAWGNNSTGQNVRVSLENGSGGAELRYRHQGGYVGWDASDITVDNGWHHVAAVVPNGAVDVGDVIFYLDGVALDAMDLVTDDNDPLNVVAGTGGTNVFLGSNWSGATAFDGQLDDIGWWNSALTADEVAAIYAGGLNGLNLQEALAPPAPAPVPEPASFALWMATALGLCGWRRIRSK